MKRTATRSLPMMAALLSFSLLICVPAFAETTVPPKTTADNPTQATVLAIDKMEATPSADIKEVPEETEASDPSEQFGPGVPKVVAKGPADDGVIDEQDGVYLGVFTTTGYCNCPACSSGYNLTASGTVPHASRTIAADPSRFPFGTKLLINGTVYTVEDRGVYGNQIDIYYDNHSSAWGHGLQKADVYLIP